ncbi:MAG: hypothetical protein KIS78_14665 [Labilithrix sp.]|nr:hypothetical protein [Labilithrix sp.]MCW5833642.1 hypothetical protein [Labilithrix sp.]
MSRRRFALTLSVGCAVVASLVGGACGPSPCTPEEFDLGGAARLTPRTLQGRPASAEACERPRVVVIRSEDELRRLYDELAGATPDAGATSDVPAVDFARESVIVREGSAQEGISWIVARGDTGVLGLLSCMGLVTPSCVVDVVAVPALLTSAETRKCDAVACGGLQAPPPPGKL